MNDRKEKYPKSYLSKQQKEILKNVCDKWTNNPAEPTDSKTVSWDIARIFNTEQGNRITENKNKEEILSKTHNASMSRSLKKLRERELVESESLFGKGKVALSEEGKTWCEINIDGFKEARERISVEFKKEREKSLLRREKIKKPIEGN